MKNSRRVFQLSLVLLACTAACGQDDTVYDADAHNSGSGVAALAQNEEVLYSFCSGGQICPDGAFPLGALVLDAAGNLYGTTSEGGIFSSNCRLGVGGGCGTVFELMPQSDGSWTEKLLHTFQYVTQDGTTPVAGLIIDAQGNLYGTTVAGGTGTCINYSVLVGCGTVFELSPRSDGEWNYTVLHNFSANGDGNFPWDRLTMAGDGALYGTTFSGGSDGGGTVFEMFRSNGQWNENVLHSFVCNGEGSGCPGGAGPYAGVILDGSGNLYGTTFAGGNVNNSYGTVFELQRGIGRWTEKVLYTFNLNDGDYPFTSLVFDKQGNLYGTTSLPGVFRLSPISQDTWRETVLYVFGATEGSVSPSSLVFDAFGNLYGATGGGGKYYGGTVFEMTRSKNAQWTENVVFSFGQGEASGSGPRGALIYDNAGNLYGTTAGGGTGASGTVFRLNR